MSAFCTSVFAHETDTVLIPVAGRIQVIHTPGHSAGHISLLVKEEGVLVAADLCSNYGKPSPSTVYEDQAVGMQSILKVSGLEFDKAVFGHGNPILKHAAVKFRASFIS